MNNEFLVVNLHLKYYLKLTFLIIETAAWVILKIRLAGFKHLFHPKISFQSGPTEDVQVQT